MTAQQDPRISRRRLLGGAAALGFGVVGWAACGGGDGEDKLQTTLDRTIALDAEGNPVYAAGEPYVVRTDVTQAQAGRETRRRSLSLFHHLSDFRILDEESPLRSEWSDLCEPPPNATAFRPQETLSVQAAEALIAAANAIDRSTVTSREVDFAIHTGNALDNAQYNELRWFLALMDGQPIYPDSGAIGYQGVQTESPAPAYGDLLEQAQRPFTPVGLKYPWYTVVGNRDVLAQGNFAYSENSNRFAIGAQKVMGLGSDALAEACSNSETLLGPGSSATIFNDPDTRIRGVGSDANRRLLTLKQWMTEHFAGAESPGPSGHGFSLQDLQGETPYYVVGGGSVHFIVLNTANPGGYSSGSIGAAQYAWLEEQLIARSSRYSSADGTAQTTGNADRLIVVVSHHGVDTMDNPFPGIDPTEQRLRGPELESLLHRYPNVVLHIAGHSMTNGIRQRSSAAGSSYWEITTGSPLQSPMQGRLIEITDNRDGTLSIFSTVYDSAAPLNPGDADDPTPDDGINQRLLAAVARQLALVDHQRDPNAGGLAPSDRNAELLIPAPFDTTTLPTPTPQPQDRP